MPWNDTMENDNSPFMCHLFSRVLKSMEAKKNLPASRSNLSLVNSLLWRTLQQKLYREAFRDVYRRKRVQLYCWVR